MQPCASAGSARTTFSIGLILEGVGKLVASEQGETAAVAAVGRLQRLGGSPNPNVSVLLTSQALETLIESEEPEVRHTLCQATLGLIEAIAPTDAFEGMLAVQMV